MLWMLVIWLITGRLMPMIIFTFISICGRQRLKLTVVLSLGRFSVEIFSPRSTGLMADGTSGYFTPNACFFNLHL